MHAKELLEVERREIRALHYTWIAFFLTFYVWFNMAPLATSMLQTESYLTPDHIKLFLIANVALTIPGRVIVGMALDRFGPRRVFSILMVVMAIPTWFFAFGDSAMQLFVSRLFMSIVGAGFVLGVSCWYLIKDRSRDFALRSIKVAAIFGLVASLLTAMTGDGSAYEVAQKQPMKLAAMEGLYEGGNGVGLVGIALINPEKTHYNDGVEPLLMKIEIPKMLSMLAERELDAYVPGIVNLIEGGYTLKDGTVALSAKEKIAKGQLAIQALANYRRRAISRRPRSTRLRSMKTSPISAMATSKIRQS